MRILLLIILLFAFSGFGQSDKKAPIPLNEFTVSVNRIFIYDKASTLDERFGFGFGVHRFWFEDKKIHLIAGITYNQYGAYKSVGHASDDPNSAYLTDMRYRFHNVTLPIAVRFHFGSSIQFFTEAGIYLNYNFNQTIIGKSEDQIKKYKLTPPDNFFDTGGTVGIGLRIPLKSNRLIIKSYYSHSIWNTGVLNLSLGFQILRKLPDN